jgi:hypothetical protein
VLFVVLEVSFVNCALLALDQSAGAVSLIVEKVTFVIVAVDVD